MHISITTISRTQKQELYIFFHGVFMKKQLLKLSVNFISHTYSNKFVIKKLEQEDFLHYLLEFFYIYI